MDEVERVQQFKGRPGIPLKSGRFDTSVLTGPPAPVLNTGHELPAVVEHSTQPFVGVTTDGQPRAGLFELADERVDPAPIIAAATAFLATLSEGERANALFPVDSVNWRMWTNAYPGWEPHGLCLEWATERQRGAFVDLLRATLSPHGADLTRDVMRLNLWLAELTDLYRDTLTEWMYFVSIFGEPSPTEPWGWQIWGHHLDVNCMFVGRQMVLSPCFLGAEPAFAHGGTYKGTRVLDAERSTGFDLYETMTDAQRRKATIYPSMRSADLPFEINGPINGRHRAGAGEDNIVLPYQGIRADELSPGGREALVKLIDVYATRLPAGPHEARMHAVRRHLDDTWFSWIGGPDRDGASYYRVHSPVILIEYDNHPGIFLDNPEPEPFHIHTIVRTPNGNDYGKDLLRQHYEQHHR